MPVYFWADVARAVTIALWGLLIMSGLGALWTSIKSERARVKAGGSRDDRFTERQNIGLGLLLLAVIYAYATEIAIRIAFNGVHTPTNTFTFFNVGLFIVTDGIMFWSLYHDRAITRRMRIRPIYGVTVHYEGDNIIAETETLPEARVVIKKGVVLHDPLIFNATVKARLASLLDTEPYLLDVAYKNVDGTPYYPAPEPTAKHRKR